MRVPVHLGLTICTNLPSYPSIVSATLQVRIVPDKQTLRIPEGAPLHLECLATGSPEPTVEWIRDVGPSRGDVPEGFTPVVIERSIVKHPAVTEANEGEYTCRASNQQMSKDAVIKVEGI